MYKSLDPAIRVVILKALCDIRVEVLLLLYANLFAVDNEFFVMFYSVNVHFYDVLY